MVEPLTGEAKTGADILGFKVGMFSQDLFDGRVVGE